MSKHCVYDSCFFNLLNKKFGRRLERAQRERCTILVPVDGSFTAGDVDATFVGYHLLSSSPLYADHFICGAIGATSRRIGSRPNGGVPLVELDRDGSLLITKEGFPFVKQVRVLTTEVAYNEYLESYHILLISEPLHTAPSTRRVLSPLTEENTVRQLQRIANHTHRSSNGRAGSFGDMDVLTGWPAGQATPPSHQEARAYLFSVPQLAPALRVIDEKVEHFNKNYVILPNFINDTVDKLKSISDTAIQMLTCNCPGDEAQLGSCIDNYVSGLAHHKVFGSVKSFCKNTDADLERRLEFLRSSDVTAESLGVREEAFHCELPQAIVELASLDAKYTPLDKLWCLRATLNSVRAEVEEHGRQSGAQFYYGEDMPALTSEVLIPLIALVVARSRPMFLASNIFYIDHFCGVKDDFSCFTISTFKAAIEFVRNFKGSQLERGLSPRTLKKELSLVDLMEVTASINENHGEAAAAAAAVAAQKKEAQFAADNNDNDDGDVDEVNQADSRRSPSEVQLLDRSSSLIVDKPDPYQQQEEPEQHHACHNQQHHQQNSLVRNSRHRSSAGAYSSNSSSSGSIAVSVGGVGGSTGGGGLASVDRKLEEITRLIEQQTLDFHLKEEEHLRRIDNSYHGNGTSNSSNKANHFGRSNSSSSSRSSSSKAAPTSVPAYVPLSSSLNSSANSLGSNEASILFSPLTSLRRSLRQQHSRN